MTSSLNALESRKLETSESGSQQLDASKLASSKAGNQAVLHPATLETRHLALPRHLKDAAQCCGNCTDVHRISS